jgi:hypothetical protein
MAQIKPGQAFITVEAPQSREYEEPCEYCDIEPSSDFCFMPYCHESGIVFRLVSSQVSK